MSQIDLFNQSTTPSTHLITLDPGELQLFERFLPDSVADNLLHSLMAELPWEQPDIQIAGRRLTIPRLQVWQGDPGLEYSYSGKQFSSVAWHPEILNLKRLIEDCVPYTFNSVLCNLYRDGQDSVSWHADDEPELGSNPVIASLSLGLTRSFHLKPKQPQDKRRHRIALSHGSLLVMDKNVQPNWLHQVPKTKRINGARINLTFRKIILRNN